MKVHCRVPDSSWNPMVEPVCCLNVGFDCQLEPLAENELLEEDMGLAVAGSHAVCRPEAGDAASELEVLRENLERVVDGRKVSVRCVDINLLYLDSQGHCCGRSLRPGEEDKGDAVRTGSDMEVQ